MTVGELISELEQYDKELPVKMYTKYKIYEIIDVFRLDDSVYMSELQS